MRMMESLRHIQRELEEVCRMLQRPTPEVLDSCVARLAAAVSHMEESRSQWPGVAGDRRVAAEVHGVRRTLSNASRLLDNAAEFHSGWGKLRAALTGGYRADGSVAETAVLRRIFVQG